MMLNTAVLCLATTGEQAERIATALKEAGFRGRDMSLLFPDRPEISGCSRRGAIGDAAVGGLAWLAEAGQLAIPGIGLLIASGPITAAMTGAAVFGSAIGGVPEVLAILGMPEHQARLYEEKLRNGCLLICVRTDGYEETAAVREIFIREGARDVVDIEDDYHGYDSAA